MHAIVRKWGSLRETSVRVVDNFYWHTPDQLFDGCSCTAPGSTVSCDRAQIRLSPGKLKLKRWTSQNIPPGVCDWESMVDGTLIFGYSSRLPMVWPEEPDRGPEEHRIKSDGDQSEGQGSILSRMSNSRQLTETESTNAVRSTTPLSSNRESSIGP